MRRGRTEPALLFSATGESRRREQVVHQCVNVESDHFGNLKELDHIDTSATALDGRNDRLIAIEFLGEIGLAQARALALLDEQINQADLSW